MNKKDRLLGMDRAISRRDILNGGAALAAGMAASQIPGAFAASEPKTFPAPSGPYPPALMGMRGNHPGSFDTAHQMGREGMTSWGPVQNAPEAPYDLIIVGAGISGLAAAHFYAKENRNARILLLDNHDDFGGHAKRNEFDVDGKKLIGYGGSQTLQEPGKYSRETKRLLKDLGITLKRFETAFDQDFWQRNGLRPGLYFGKETWGERRMVPFNLGMFSDYLYLGSSDVTPEQAVDMMPMSQPAKVQMLRLLTLKEEQLTHIPEDDRWEYMYNISYRDFIEKHMGVTEPEVFKVLQDLTSDAGVGIEATSAFSATSYGGLPGWAVTGLPDEPFENYIHHFPDGNTSIARLIVRNLIREVAPAGPAEEIVTKRFDYSKLDQADAPVRLRLSATAVNVAQNGDTVDVVYVKDGAPTRVSAAKCVMATNHSIVPHVMPQLPDGQREAFSSQERTPILYNSVAVRNWQPWKKLGIGAVYAPGSYFVHTMMDFPVSLGGYSYSEDPSQPVIIHMERFPHVNNSGMTKREQARAGRHELLGTSFEEIEREIRSQLTGMLELGGFDPARDIAGITVNRWAHGYAYSYNPLFDETYDDWDDPRAPHMIARKPFGRITFANSDSGASALFDSAVDNAYRAVEELEGT